MQFKLGENYWGVTGTISRDPEMRLVGENAIPKLSLGVYAGKRKDTTKVYVDCAAWRDLAQALNGLKKGDSFFGVGSISEREYNGKTYKTLELDFGISPNTHASFANKPVPVENPASPAPKPDDAFTEPENYDDELPF